MAPLENLKGLRQIGGYKVVNMSQLEEILAGVFSGDNLKQITNAFDSSVFIRYKDSTISFKIQNGPIKESGINGCQVGTLIETVKIIISGFNDKMSCPENEECLTYLDAALLALDKRTNDRKKRGVEGTSNE